MARTFTRHPDFQAKRDEFSRRDKFAERIAARGRKFAERELEALGFEDFEALAVRPMAKARPFAVRFQ